MNTRPIGILTAVLLILVVTAATANSQALLQSNRSARQMDTISDLKVKGRAYYHIAGLGSSEGDFVGAFPRPTAVLQVLDTINTRIAVRFPELGLLGLREDTAWMPSFYVGDSLRGFVSKTPLLSLSFPKTQYFVFIDVWSRDGRLLDSRPVEYDMNVEKYRSAKLAYYHEPTSGLGNETLRRRFIPTLLPLTLEANPGWGSTETLDSSGTYALTFRDPRQPTRLELSVTLRPALVGKIDSEMWKNFKMKAELAFGAKGIAVSSENDFNVHDSVTHRFIREGFEFVARNQDSTLEYVAAFLTPRAILLLLAPFNQPNQQLEYDYFREIARSFKLD